MFVMNDQRIWDRLFKKSCRSFEKDIKESLKRRKVKIDCFEEKTIVWVAFINTKRKKESNKPSDSQMTYTHWKTLCKWILLLCFSCGAIFRLYKNTYVYKYEFPITAGCFVWHFKRIIYLVFAFSTHTNKHITTHANTYTHVQRNTYTGTHTHTHNSVH